MDINKLDNLYTLYKFHILPVSNKNIRVYSFTNKYFSNADIIILNEIKDTDLKDIVEQVESLGFSTKLRNYKTIVDAEESLFDGFFDVERSNNALKKGYEDYTNKVSKLIFSSYKYINSECIDIENDSILKDNIVDTILNNINITGPVLVLLEAPAGFGKTSTSYEVVNKMVQDSNTKRIPLFTELSRNRQASIFKYVLYDEINSRFPGSTLELIIKHVTDGRIPLIIDGFDELLKPNTTDRGQDRFEDVEPMLETIKELLRGNAKIVLTTRKTAIFSDDEFIKWLEDCGQKFKFFRYSISEPTISDWIPPTREKQIQKAGLNLRSISNPVLLSYLRSLDDQQFANCVNDIDQIIEDYLIKLMDRENIRQDLNMTIDEQRKIMQIISSHFTNNDITAETKENIEKLILEKAQTIIFSVLERFNSSNRPTFDQYVNKLIIHAFLDRKGDSGHQVGFVNDFILGSFVGTNLLEETINWFGTERFIDFILTAFMPRGLNIKREIYEVLSKDLLQYLPVQKQIYIDNYFFGTINRGLAGEFISNLEFRSQFKNDFEIRDTFFTDCEYHGIDFSHTKKITSTHFINCKFFNCIGPSASEELDKNFHFISCLFDPPFKIERISPSVTELNDGEMAELQYQRKVLEKFWQSGKDKFIPHKRIGTLRLGIPPEEIIYIDRAITQLIRKNFIIQRRGQHSLQLNIEFIKEIKNILGR